MKIDQKESTLLIFDLSRKELNFKHLDEKRELKKEIELKENEINKIKKTN